MKYVYFSIASLSVSMGMCTYPCIYVCLYLVSCTLCEIKSTGVIYKYMSSLVTIMLD